MIDVPLCDELFHGHVSLQRDDNGVVPWRLPIVDKPLYYTRDNALWTAAGMPSGVRLRLRTDATALALNVEAVDQRRSFDIVIDGEIAATTTIEPNETTVAFTDLPAGEKTAELWLWHVGPVRLQGLSAEATFAQAAPDDRPRWTTYGSSITHCGEATSPARTWPAIVARKHGLNLTSLGLAGNCHMEPMLSRLIRDLPADVISLKVGINIYQCNSLNQVSFPQALIGMVQIIREKHPDVPIAVCSPVCAPGRDGQGNQVGMPLSQYREYVADAVNHLLDAGEANLFYVNGMELFDDALAHDYMPDFLHPNEAGYAKLAENFSECVMSRLLNMRT